MKYNAYLCTQNIKKKIMDINKKIKTKKDVIQFFKEKMADKQAWIDCVREGRPLSELKSRGMEVAKLNTILK